MNNILLIEDRTDFADQFAIEAKSRNINIVHRKSFEGLQEILPSLHHKFAAVILDIKCLMTDNQVQEDAGFIGAAMNFLNQNLPLFPRYILTGDDAEFDKFKSYFSKEKLYLKTPSDLKSLFEELKHCVDQSETLRVKREHYLVFEIFEKKRMNDVAERLLLKILLSGLLENDPGKFKGILSDVRSMQETIYKTINSKNTNIVPNNVFETNGKIKFNQLMTHLNGYPDRQYKPTRTIYQNGTIYNLANTLYWSCGEYIHEDPKRTYFISHYTVKTLINSLMELLLWGRQYLI